ncbi:MULTISPECIES: hypothetical protein [Pseudomonas]|uniref:Fis family transcriptional regulator n=1 Tax=Pseudomonas simiae TaxID=321846 RepID=A0A1I0VX40_9PSED|nr:MULTISPECIES: hypothetical protein [Pseudomonas]VVO08037.1 hypothetical protein PS708_03192 [Pseudomonas fluorescens]AJP53435.1 hypothetical protein PF1751_v1c37350 [Pseudomonas simiae]AJZ95183.1 hypothetical protein PFLUOLIPICF7_17550 [Pseudomonas simiae]ERH61160.1 hypothetical protein O204_00130 [Pseudomonas simiae]KIQ08606.1 hypothetical protein RU03_19720 [Pseudomonas simiae]
MTSSKRDSARIERRLVATLTDACETAKAEIPGFEWLTHTVNYADFPHSLRITWVFDTRANQAHAVATGLDARLRELTATALHDAEIPPVHLARCVHVDSEEACHAQHGGNWRLRLTRSAN